ncbi:hypothetical protein HDV01_004539 [Terramyces sp. JEL0728]|nr:hypothetical protein HDV01_004539 [Terramyces sp. JEL0728]
MPIINGTYKPISEPAEGFKTLSAFYPFYLGEHANITNRRLHIIGTTGVVALLTTSFFHPRLLLAIPLVGYGFAWFGHFVFEKNKPATFRYPIYSLICDFKMWSEVVSFQRPF